MARFQINGEEMVRKKVSKHGGSGHVYVPKRWIGKMVTVILEDGDKKQVSNPGRRKRVKRKR